MSGLTPLQESMVRLIYTLGTAREGDLPRASGVRAGSLRALLRTLAARGWLEPVPDAHTPGAPAWAVTEPALPHLWCDERLPRVPGPIPAFLTRPLPRTPVMPRTPVAARPPPAVPLAPCPAPRRPTPPAPYVPPPAAPLRAGAMDFLNHPSHGWRA
ncbi:MAG: hypothetical protein Q4G71_03845 [Pseudomonadota bacterium]|nr:hypothetical protein [Pseudomonadota bacterium]